MLKFFFTNNQPPLKSPSLSQIHSQSIPNTPTATVTAPSSPLPPTSTPARISPKKKRERSSCSSTDNIRNTASTNSNTCQISVYDDEQDHTCEVLPNLMCNNRFEALNPSEPVADPDPPEAENVCSQSDVPECEESSAPMCNFCNSPVDRLVKAGTHNLFVCRLNYGSPCHFCRDNDAHFCCYSCHKAKVLYI